MGKLAEALKRKYKTPKEAIAALGLDEAILRESIATDELPSFIKEKAVNPVYDFGYGFGFAFDAPQLYSRSQLEAMSEGDLRSLAKNRGMSSGAVRISSVKDLIDNLISLQKAYYGRGSNLDFDSALGADAKLQPGDKVDYTGSHPSLQGKEFEVVMSSGKTTVIKSGSSTYKVDTESLSKK